MGQKSAPKFELNLLPVILTAAEKQVSREIVTPKCQELGDQRVRAARLFGSNSTAASPLRQSGAAVVRAIICARRLRNESFEPRLFSDPAWDILLDLYLAKVEQRRVSVSSLCIAAAVPQSTALRQISWLVSRGLVERHPNKLDGRVTFVEITEGGCSSMRNFLDRLPKPS